MAKKKENFQKLCVICNEMIPETKRADSLTCSALCQKRRVSKKYNTAHKDYFKKYAKEYNKKNREKINTRQRKLRYNRFGWTGTAFQEARKLGFRSMFEVRVADDLKRRGIPAKYESRKLSYTVGGTYTPDFLLENGIIVECKGRFTPEDKRKMRAVKASHPTVDIRFLFQRKTSSNIRWAEKNGFKWAVGKIPQDWLSD